MKTLMQKYFIIKQKKERWSDRKIAAEYHISSRGYLKYNEQMNQALKKILEDEKRKTALLGPHHKQKLTKKQIHQLLVDMGFDIGLTTISNMMDCQHFFGHFL